MPKLFIFLYDDNSVVPLIRERILEIIGLRTLRQGLIEILYNRDTKNMVSAAVNNKQSKFGSSNSEPIISKVKTEIINADTYEIETVYEYIAPDGKKYHNNAYILCKYYEGILVL